MRIPAPYAYRKGTSGDAIYLPFDEEQFKSFPDVMEWGVTTLLKKTEFHATLLHVKNAAALVHSDEDQITSFFVKFVATKPIQFVSFINDFRYVEENEKKTIVIRCDITNLEPLFAGLNKKFNIEMPTQPPHITLYTLQKNIGIHIPSDEIMKSLSGVDIPELAEALKKVRPV